MTTLPPLSVQVRHNEAALEQLISGAQAIAALSQLLDASSQPLEVCQGAATLVSGLCATSMDAKLQVGCLLVPAA